MSYYDNQIELIGEWSALKTEDDNFYYALTEASTRELAFMIALVTGESLDAVRRYISELNEDVDLRDHIRNCLHREPSLADLRVEYGRRVGWYAFVRVLKPRLVVETGVYHGMGACVLATALEKNAQDGVAGTYLGTDIDPSAGRLFTERYQRFGEIRYGDSLETLKSINDEIDVFINDSDHSRQYEAQEYQEVSVKLGQRSLVLGDNSHASDALMQFSEQENRPFLLFHEQPTDHWYPGAGIGISPARIPLMEHGRS